MSNAFKVGWIFGINIFVDWSWLFIFWLVTWNLADGVFRELHPEWTPVISWVTAVVASLLFFASVLAHEISHSLVARAQGTPVRNITLFLFGGVANIQREPTSAKSEFVMAIVGPLTSMALGVFFLLAGGVRISAFGATVADPIAAMSRLDPLSTLLLWLGPINIIVGIFNLVPGFPLDGGRVLRSIVWGVTGNLRRATFFASLVGQAVAWIFVFVGVAMIFGIAVPFFGSGLIGGLWLALIGWFLHHAAAQSYRQVVIEDLLAGVSVAELMRANVTTVPSQIPVSTLVHDYILGTDERSFPVIAGDNLVGLVSLEDVRQVNRDKWVTTKISEIMTPATKLTLATPREDAAEAFNDLSSHDVQQLPVVQDGRLVGMLRQRDVVRWLRLDSKFAK